jgi:hypothetical protein
MNNGKLPLNLNKWISANTLFSGNSNPSQSSYNYKINEDIEAGDTTSMLSKISKNVKESIEVEPSYKTFFLVLSIGIFFVLFSMMFLPFLVISPQKFLTFFSIGSFLVLISFIFIQGTTTYLKTLFYSDRKLYTFSYLLSLILGLYFAYFKGYYIITLISALIQVVMLIVFILTFIPGGRTGIGFLYEMLKTTIKALCSKLTGK